MSPSESSASKFDSAWLLLQVDGLCDRFELAWQEGERPSIESYLVEFAQTREQSLADCDPESSAGQAPGLQHSRLLHTLVEHLIGVDVEYRRRAGEQIDWESYSRRFQNFSAAVNGARLQRAGDPTEIDSSESIQPLVSPPPSIPAGESSAISRGPSSDLVSAEAKSGPGLEDGGQGDGEGRDPRSGDRSYKEESRDPRSGDRSYKEERSRDPRSGDRSCEGEKSGGLRPVTRWRLVLGGLGILGVSVATAIFWRPSLQSIPPPQPVVIESIPVGARLSWTLVEPWPADQPPVLRESIAGEPIDLAPGFYRVAAEVGGEYFEVFRTVPVPGDPPVLTQHDVPLPHRSFQWEGNVVHLPAIRIAATDALPGDWTELPGGTVTIPEATRLDASLRGKSYNVTRFQIDRHEITWNELRTVYPQLTLAVHQQVLEGGIPFDLAVAYAEQVGKQLPSMWEMVWAATNRGATKFSWGDSAPSVSPAAVAADPSLFRDVTPGAGAIRNLQLGQVEWTATLRTVRRSASQDGGSTDRESFVYGVLDGLAPGARVADAWVPAIDGGEFISTTQLPHQASFRCVRRLER